MSTLYLNVAVYPLPYGNLPITSSALATIGVEISWTFTYTP